MVGGEHNVHQERLGGAGREGGREGGMEGRKALKKGGE